MSDSISDVASPRIDEAVPAGCGCSKCGSGGSCSCNAVNAQEASRPQLVYALGQIGYDFVSEARRDSFAQAMPSSGNNPANAVAILDYLAQRPEEAASITWTLNLDATVIYALQPAGPFADKAYERIVESYASQIREGSELVSVPGMMAGSVRLQSGQVVPRIVPAMRGMFTWTPGQLVMALFGTAPEADSVDRAAYEKQTGAVTEFINRVYYQLRNLGVTAEERALNFAATNAFQVSDVARRTADLDLDLDSIKVRRSPICRQESDCYDVELAFFNASNTNVANRIYRFTVDVSDVVPVTIGGMRSWTQRPR